jgi:hypothetical protein
MAVTAPAILDVATRSAHSSGVGLPAVAELAVEAPLGHQQ